MRCQQNTLQTTDIIYYQQIFSVIQLYHSVAISMSCYTCKVTHVKCHSSHYTSVSLSVQIRFDFFCLSSISQWLLFSITRSYKDSNSGPSLHNAYKTNTVSTPSTTKIQLIIVHIRMRMTKLYPHAYSLVLYLIPDIMACIYYRSSSVGVVVSHLASLYPSCPRK